jgi:hypothetical protein
MDVGIDRDHENLQVHTDTLELQGVEGYKENACQMLVCWIKARNRAFGI